MNEVQAFEAMQRGETVARAKGLVVRRIENGRVVIPGGPATANAAIDIADDWEVVPREPTLLELASKIWPDTSGFKIEPFDCIAGSASDDSVPHIALRHRGFSWWTVTVGPTKAAAERRARVAMNAIIADEKL